MITREAAKQLLSDALNKSAAEQTEILLARSQSGLSRFANSEIHQSTNRHDDYIQARAVIDKKIGVASTNQLGSLNQTVQKAVEAARLATPKADFVSLPKEGFAQVDAFRYSRKTAGFGPAERASYIEKIIKQADNYQTAGIFETGQALMAIANSEGVFSFQKQTKAEINTIFLADSESSYAYSTSFDVDRLDAEELGKEAYDTARLSKETVTLEPGRYTVILKPAAVAEMLGLLAYAGFGALAFIEQRSFMNNKIGQQIASSQINLLDKVADEHSLGWLFDFEGVKRQKVNLIRDGIAKDVVYDSFTANKTGHPNTGHALPATSKIGPLPLNILLEPGRTSTGGLIKDTKKGLLINRFHYTNLENPIETIFTGMTRDGTFLIQNGKLTKAVTNLRITQSILQALLKVEAIGSDPVLAGGVTGQYYVPSLKIKDFNFSSATI